MAQQAISPIVDPIPAPVGMATSYSPDMLPDDKCQLLLNLLADRPGILRGHRWAHIKSALTGSPLIALASAYQSSPVGDTAYVTDAYISATPSTSYVAVGCDKNQFYGIYKSGYNADGSLQLIAYSLNAYNSYKDIPNGGNFTFFGGNSPGGRLPNAQIITNNRGFVAVFPNEAPIGSQIAGNYAFMNYQGYDWVSLGTAVPLLTPISPTAVASAVSSPFATSTVLDYAICATDQDNTMFGPMAYFSYTVTGGFAPSISAQVLQTTVSGAQYFSLYRALQGAAGVYYQVATFAANSSYTDTTTDIAIEGNITAPDPQEYYPFRPFTVGVNHAGRMVTDDYWFPSQVQFSTYDNPYATSNPTSVDASGNLIGTDGAILRIGAKEEDFITGFASTGTALYVLTRGGQFIVTGTDPNSWIPQPLSGSHGCIAPYSVSVSGQAVYYLGYDGVYVVDGTQTQKISRDIDSAILPAIANTANYVSQNAVGWHAYNAYNLCIGNTIYRFDEINGGWTSWQFGVEPLSGACMIYDGATKYELLSLQHATEPITAVVMQQPESTAAPAVSWRYVTRAVGAPGARAVNKRLVRIQVYGSSSAGTTGTATVWTDNTSWTFTPVFNSPGNDPDGMLFEQDVPDYIVGRIVYIDISGTGSGTIIGQINAFYEVVRE